MIADRARSIPFYLQLADHLRARIARGDFLPGSRMPSEQQLIEQTRLSRITVRQGLAVLAQSGWVIKQQGRGTFAGRAIDQELSSVRTIPEVLVSQGLTPEITVLGFAEVVAPPPVNERLQLSPAERVVRIKRLYHSEGKPIAVLHAYVPRALKRHADVLRDERMPTETTFSIMERHLGIRLKEARHEIRAARAGAEVARALGVRRGDPILVLERVTVAAGGEPVEYDLFHYHAERYTFSITVPRRSPPRVSAPARQRRGRPSSTRPAGR
ncbi:MAG: GntR family transcriptional regulator [Candidatus Rokuibacteriota bacterium]